MRSAASPGSSRAPRKPARPPAGSRRRQALGIRERISQVKADQKARGRFLGGKRPFGFWRGDNGELIPNHAEQAASRRCSRCMRSGAR